MKIHSKKLIKNSRQGFTLIELMVAMFIFMLIMGAMVAVSVAGFRSYGKSKAIKTVTEDVGFAINSIAKEVRMGKIENGATSGVNYAKGGVSDYLLITRNRGGRVCYRITATTIGVKDFLVGTDCSGGTYNEIVNLAGTNMTFDTITSKFRSCETDNTGVLAKACNAVTEKHRGWAEINLNIDSPGMETDSIFVQTIVSSRDYGWEEVAP